MSPWLRNRPAALLTGLVLGTAVQEMLRSAADAFLLLGSLNDRIVEGTGDPSITSLMLFSALVGGAVAGLATSSLCTSLRTGVAAGVLMAVPAVPLAAAMLQGSMLAVLHAAPPICGAALGARWALGTPEPRAR